MCPLKVGACHHRITRGTSKGPARRKSFLDNRVCEEEGLANRLEPSSQSLTFIPFEPGGRMVGFFEHQTHFGSDLGAAPGPPSCPVFCGDGRNAPDKLRRDHSRAKFRNEIIDQIEQGAHKTYCRIHIFITMFSDVMYKCLTVK
jgi:hypothetical protein